VSDFGAWGSIHHHERYLQGVEPRSRRQCRCGCKKRATHLGMTNGVGLMMGCEFYVRRWVRDGLAIYRTRTTPNESTPHHG